MASKKTITTTTSASNGGKQIFLTASALSSLEKLQKKMAMESDESWDRYTGSRWRSNVIEDLAAGVLTAGEKLESLADKTS